MKKLFTSLLILLYICIFIFAILYKNTIVLVILSLFLGYIIINKRDYMINIYFNDKKINSPITKDNSNIIYAPVIIDSPKVINNTIVDNKEFKDKQNNIYHNDFNVYRIRNDFKYSKKLNLSNVLLKGGRYEEKNKIFELINIGDTLTFKREPQNNYDKNSIKVYWNKKHIGYIPRELASDIVPMLDNGDYLLGEVHYTNTYKSIYGFFTDIEMHIQVVDDDYFTSIPPDGWSSASIIETTSEKRQEILKILKRGDNLTFERDYERKKFEGKTVNVLYKGIVVGILNMSYFYAPKIDSGKKYIVNVSKIILNKKGKYNCDIFINEISI